MRDYLWTDILHVYGCNADLRPLSNSTQFLHCLLVFAHIRFQILMLTFKAKVGESLAGCLYIVQLTWIYPDPKVPCKQHGFVLTSGRDQALRIMTLE